MSSKFRHKKSLGQHFLVDDHISEQIVNSFITSCSTKTILEIGPGKGVLTEHLYAHSDLDYHLSEADFRLFDYLSGNYSQATLHEGDFLKQDWSQIFKGKFSIIGNFPYNISSQIIFKVLEMRERVPLLVGMFQKEVADRIASEKGSKTYGILSVMTQSYFRCEKVLDVGKEAFDPPPKVNSSVIKLIRLPKDPDIDYEVLRMVVKAAFNQRRKKVSNALKGLMVQYEIESIPYADLRAEQIGLEEFIDLSQRFTR